MSKVIAKPPPTAEQRRQELAEANTRIDEAERLHLVADDHRRDISRLEAQRDRLAALGDRHIEIPQKSFNQEYGVEVTWVPLRSQKTGNELAASVENSIEPLRSELARVDSQIEGLLA